MEETAYTTEFYATPSGNEPVRDFLDMLSVKARQKCFSYIDLLALMGLALRASHIKKLEGDIWELRPEFGGTEYRIFFGRHGTRFILLHAVTKKRQKTARTDIVMAQRRFNDWQEQG